MALVNTSRRAVAHIGELVVRPVSRLVSSHQSPPRDSCTPSERPACPPCESPRAPPCRRPGRSAQRAVRVVCCPPPAGQRPPCPPTPPACPLTCQNRLSLKDAKTSSATTRPVASNSSKCGSQLDRVARRLAAAERERRDQYEREASQPPPPHRPQYAAYELAGERHCARATDGRDYMCSEPGEHAAPPACTADRTPPPPTPVRLTSSEGCDIQSVRHLDPCAHRPRVFVKIDRSRSDLTKKVESKPKESITARLMDSLKLKKSANSFCPRIKCGKNNADKRNDWCKSPPKLEAVPPRCREPNLAERLRQKSKTNESHPRREFHSSACRAASRPAATSTQPASPTAAGTISDNGNLTLVLKEKEKLKESGRGRSVGLINNDFKTPRQSNSGSIELRVPSDVEAVKVRVSLDFSQNHAEVLHGSSLSEVSSRCLQAAGRRGDSDTWLSIKNIQERLSGCRKKSDPKHSEQKKVCPGRPTVTSANPCAAAGLKKNVKESSTHDKNKTHFSSESTNIFIV